jgi:hypothetical protein
MGMPRYRCAARAGRLGWSWLTLAQRGKEVERVMGIEHT